METVGTILFWRDVRLLPIENFAIIVKGLGGIEKFVDLERTIRKIAQVQSPTALSSELAERNLVQRLRGLPELEAIPTGSLDQLKHEDADDVVLGAADETQATEAEKSEPPVMKPTMVINSDAAKQLKASIQEGLMESINAQMNESADSILEKTTASSSELFSARIAEEGDAMKTTMASFHIPPTSMYSFDILSVASFIFIYRQIIGPMVSKLHKSEGLTKLERMGIGLVIAVLAMLSAGGVEHFCLMHAQKDCSRCVDSRV
ncbi:hypothetical protein OROMI_003839 [Orobanche minor]